METGTPSIHIHMTFPRDRLPSCWSRIPPFRRSLGGDGRPILRLCEPQGTKRAPPVSTFLRHFLAIVYPAVGAGSPPFRGSLGGDGRPILRLCGPW